MIVSFRQLRSLDQTSATAAAAAPVSVPRVPPCGGRAFRDVFIGGIIHSRLSELSTPASTMFPLFNSAVVYRVLNAHAQRLHAWPSGRHFAGNPMTPRGFQ